MFQYNAALTVTGAIKGTCHDKIKSDKYLSHSI